MIGSVVCTVLTSLAMLLTPDPLKTFFSLKQKEGRIRRMEVFEVRPVIKIKQSKASATAC